MDDVDIQDIVDVSDESGLVSVPFDTFRSGPERHSSCAYFQVRDLYNG